MNIHHTRRVLVALCTLGASLGLIAPLPAGAGTPRCFGEPATIVAPPEENITHGTPGDDVIVGNDTSSGIYGYGGRDLICGGKRPNSIYGGAGDDRMKNFVIVEGGPGDDY